MMTLPTSLIAQLLFLESENPKKDINLYINSPGGFGDRRPCIIDTMTTSKRCIDDLRRIGLQWARIFLPQERKGKRLILPNAEVMIHQPLGGAEGQAADIEISAKHIIKTRDRLNKILRDKYQEANGQGRKDMDRNNFFMSAEEAKNTNRRQSTLTPLT